MPSLERYTFIHMIFETRPFDKFTLSEDGDEIGFFIVLYYIGGVASFVECFMSPFCFNINTVLIVKGF